MKSKQWQEMKNLTQEELTTQLEQKERKLFDLSVQHKFAPLKNPLQISGLRKDIARMKSLSSIKFNKKI